MGKLRKVAVAVLITGIAAVSSFQGEYSVASPMARAATPVPAPARVAIPSEHFGAQILTREGLGKDILAYLPIVLQTGHSKAGAVALSGLVLTEEGERRPGVTDSQILAAQTLASVLSYENQAGGRGRGRWSKYAARGYLEENAPENLKPQWEQALWDPDSSAFEPLLRAASKLSGLNTNRLLPILDALYLGESADRSPMSGAASEGTLAARGENATSPQEVVGQFYEQAGLIVPLRLPLLKGSRAWRGKSNNGGTDDFVAPRGHPARAGEFVNPDQAKTAARFIARELSKPGREFVGGLLAGMLTDPGRYRDTWRFFRDPRFAGQGQTLIGHLILLGKLKRFAYKLADLHGADWRTLAQAIGAELAPLRPRDVAGMLRHMEALFQSQ